MGAVPGGALSTFCEPVYTTSTPHWSAWNGTPPREATVSTTNRQLRLQVRESWVRYHAVMDKQLGLDGIE